MEVMGKSLSYKDWKGRGDRWGQCCVQGAKGRKVSDGVVWGDEVREKA